MFHLICLKRLKMEFIDMKNYEKTVKYCVDVATKSETLKCSFSQDGVWKWTVFTKKGLDAKLESAITLAHRWGCLMQHKMKFYKQTNLSDEMVKSSLEEAKVGHPHFSSKAVNDKAVELLVSYWYLGGKLASFMDIQPHLVHKWRDHYLKQPFPGCPEMVSKGFRISREIGE